MSGVTGMEGYIWQSCRYDAYGNITFGKPEYNNVYGYNGESYNPNLDAIDLRARYYNPATADFMTEDSYLGDIRDPLTLNRYNYVKSSPLNYADPSGYYTMVQGTDAHQTLFNYLKGKPNVTTEFIIKNYRGVEGQIGIADIVYKRSDGSLEVYELKTASEPLYRGWIKKYAKKWDLLTGPQQRKEYIEALRNNKIKVHENGTTLNSILNIKLQSLKYPDKTIVYETFAVEPGMVYWHYEKDNELQVFLELLKILEKDFVFLLVPDMALEEIQNGGRSPIA